MRLCYSILHFRGNRLLLDPGTDLHVIKLYRQFSLVIWKRIYPQQQRFKGIWDKYLTLCVVFFLLFVKSHEFGDWTHRKSLPFLHLADFSAHKFSCQSISPSVICINTLHPQSSISLGKTWCTKMGCLCVWMRQWCRSSLINTWGVEICHSLAQTLQ